MVPEFIYLISEHFFPPLRLSLRKPKEVLTSHDEVGPGKIWIFEPGGGAIYA